MRILVVGAGAVGGYFGAHLVAAGRDVTFLVREARAERLRADGLTVARLNDDLTVTPRATTAADLVGEPPFDLVLLSVKSFALDQAIADIAPAVGPETAIVPLLNGLRHIETLQAEFGDRVLGGLCFVATMLDGDVVRQLSPLQTIMFGELDGSRTPKVDAILADLQDAGFEATASDHIRHALWEKWFILASGGAVTTLLGGDVGTIESVPNGTSTALAIVAEAAAVAAAHGFEPRPAMRERAESTLTERGSDFTTSMFRDMSQGLEVESDQILGDLVRRGLEKGVPVPLLAAASARLEVYRAGRA
ncbi:ketopantoate reductase family protein [Frondihabitans australicus]|uniref:2-dehydropantoate 2-reductase n=1 Tax=Frondihabitans australicus TaxID=386892 RepID=A0A495IKV8_9MICO|nr:ketopantoate reductase family protein [Frondihabitans australicus]RKR76068.1 ketopantoate reductase [Frondihabitans australicus]